MSNLFMKHYEIFYIISEYKNIVIQALIKHNTLSLLVLNLKLKIYIVKSYNSFIRVRRCLI